MRLHTPHRRKWLLRQQQARRAQFWQGSEQYELGFAISDRHRRPIGFLLDRDALAKVGHLKTSGFTHGRQQRGNERIMVFYVDGQHRLSQGFNPNRFATRRLRMPMLHSAAQLGPWRVRLTSSMKIGACETPQVAGLGNLDPAHVSEHRAFSQAAHLARVALSRLSSHNPSTMGFATKGT